MKTLIILLLIVVLPVTSFGQNDSSRLNFKKNYVDYLGEDTIQAFFWNGTIARCPTPSPLFHSLDSVKSDLLIVIMYMPMKYDENGEVNKRTVKETIQNIKGGEEEMYFLGIDILNERLDVFTCHDYLMSVPIKTIRRRSNKLFFVIEDDYFLGNYKIQINKDKKVICNIYNKRLDQSEIFYSSTPEIIQIFK